MDSKNFCTAVSEAAFARPEFFRCPAPKVRDQHFGLTRGWYYKHFQAGDIRMVALRKRGQTRGVALIDYDSVKRFIDKCAVNTGFDGQSTK